MKLPDGNVTTIGERKSTEANEGGAKFCGASYDDMEIKALVHLVDKYTYREGTSIVTEWDTITKELNSVFFSITDTKMA